MFISSTCTNNRIRQQAKPILVFSKSPKGSDNSIEIIKHIQYNTISHTLTLTQSYSLYRWPTIYIIMRKRSISIYQARHGHVILRRYI